ncbi:hypothetical protein Rs2_47435 [Raphanus sativus]|nr:hypothetical protein Rs2_47435 [Raphanus sativus]
MSSIRRRGWDPGISDGFWVESGYLKRRNQLLQRIFNRWGEEVLIFLEQPNSVGLEDIGESRRFLAGINAIGFLALIKARSQFYEGINSDFPSFAILSIKGGLGDIMYGDIVTVIWKVGVCGILGDGFSLLNGLENDWIQIVFDINSNARSHLSKNGKSGIKGSAWDCIAFIISTSIL